MVSTLLLASNNSVVEVCALSSTL